MPASHALLSPAQHTDDEPPLSAASLSAIRLLTLPETGPPFDDDLAARAVTGTDAPVGDATPARAVFPPAEPVRADADRDWARQFARLLTEALSGARPVRQILPWTTDRAHGQLRAVMPLFGGGHRPRLLRVIATRPTLDVIEMTVVAGVGARTRALAVRLERADPAKPRTWLNPAGLPARLPQPGTAAAKATATASTAPRWLCTDIEAA